MVEVGAVPGGVTDINDRDQLGNTRTTKRALTLRR
jgi:hypothetical protein